MGVAGGYAREKAARIRRLGLTLTVVLPIVGLLALATNRYVAALVSGVTLGILIAIERELLPAWERWSRGAVGEEVVGDVLAELEATGRWHAVHDISSGRGNVDHVLIGPPGVCTLETKNHRGRVDEVERRMLNQAWAQKKWLEESTGLTAQPLLVFSRAWVERPGRRERGVTVLSARVLRRNLEQRPARFTSEQVTAAHRTIASLTVT